MVGSGRSSTYCSIWIGSVFVQASVKKMRDAVQSVWDQTIRGMNAGKSVWELMRDIQLPKELELSQGHGRVSWSVRGIWEIVTGWYSYDTIADLYFVPPTAVNGDLVELAGGADALARMLQGGPGKEEHIREIEEREHEADTITRDVTAAT